MQPFNLLNTSETKKDHMHVQLLNDNSVLFLTSFCWLINLLILLSMFKFSILSPLRWNWLLKRQQYLRTEFKPTPERFNFPAAQEETLKFWQQIDAFKQQLQKTKHLPPYSFYDGPPFATGTPHYGHIAAGTIKDVVCRYASQTGHFVQRRFGWDCHGLPVEYQIDKQLKITHKRQVLQMGIEKYNESCRNIVMRYSGQWERIIGRFGRWIDFQNDYKTMDLKFMESVWYVFKQLFDKGLVYRGRRIMPYSNACNTVLSNFQVQQNYKFVNDPSIHVTFPLKTDQNVKLLAWTTTPWTLPSNLALAVNPNLTYVKVKDQKRNQIFILAQSRLKDFFGKDKYQILSKMKGTELQGLQYQPLYDYYLGRKKDGCFKVQLANFVTDSDGTGIVHCAPGFGQDDYNLCVQKKLITPDDPPVPLDDNGRFTKQISDYEGKYVKDADELIMDELKLRKRLVKRGSIQHNYPFCWRSQTPLIYKAVSTWFIRVTELRDDLVKNNHKAQWVPKVIQQKKFDNWLKDVKDWCFSRNRFWGNPIPLWVSDDGEEVICVGSLKELEELTGTKVTDLHRENIDHLTIESRMGKKKLRRIQEVFDCWFQSGSMPFAQVHYPFSISEQKFSKIFPADFIGEGIDQTRGWFYTLNVISTGLRNSHPYKNLIVNGLVLSQDGKKMSKRLKNYPDTMDMCNQFGADAVRLYLINSPLVRADNLNFSKEGVRGVIKEIFLPWYNSYRFLIQNISKWETQTGRDFKYNQDIVAQLPNFTITDRWIQSSLQELIKNVRKEMDQYKLYNVVPQLIKFLDHLTNWYVRLNRPRLKGQMGEAQMQLSLNILFDVLLKVNVLMSPHVPFLAEHMYQNMKLAIRTQSKNNQPSIHHLMISHIEPLLFTPQITEQMNIFMSVIETSRKLREIKKISLKQPITSLTIINRQASLLQKLQPYLEYIKDQINVDSIQIETNFDKYVKLQALPNLPVFGPKFKGNTRFNDIKTAITNLTTEQLQIFRLNGTISVLDQIFSENDILVQQKFISNTVEDYQAIGGKQVIVLLDIRQSQSLKIRGFARQIITRVQKLKKQAKLVAEDPIIIFFQFSPDANYLRRALEVEKITIASAVKRPILDMSQYSGLKILGQDKGAIDEEQYLIRLCPLGPICLRQQLQMDFGDKSAILIEKLIAIPYENLKSNTVHEILLEGQIFKLHEKKHYRFI